MVRNIYDITLKTLNRVYREKFLEYIGENAEIEGRELSEKIYNLKDDGREMDHLWALKDGEILHLEFQFKPTTKNDLERFYGYNRDKSSELNEIIDTCVVNCEVKEKCEKEVCIGRSIQFRPLNKFLGDIDYGSRLNIIEDKVKNNIELNAFEEIDLVLVSLVPKTKNKIESVKNVCNLIKRNNTMSQTNKHTISKLITLQIDKFIGDVDEKSKCAEMIGVESVDEIIKEIAYHEAYNDGKREGYDSGLDDGKSEMQEEMVLNFLNNSDLTVEDISQIQNIPVEFIEDICRKHDIAP